MPQLDPTWFASQLFWLFVSFVALYFILSRLALPPVVNIIARREQTVASDLDRAQQLKTQAEKARQDYEQTLADARSRAQQLFNEALATQKTKSDQASKAMDAQIAAQLTDAKAKIAAKKQQLMEALAPASEELATMIVEKLTRQAVSGKTQSVVVESLKIRNR